MGDYDDDLFRREMAGVAPLKDDDRVREHRRREPTLTQRLRRASATARPNRDPNPLTVPEQVPEAGPYDIVGVKKNGVQEGVYRKLRLGKYDPQARLDLHRVRLMEARDQVYLFIREAQQNGQRTVLINHGKGQHSERPALLKSYVMHWLSEFDQVLAFHSAPPQQGGAGVTLALLRKTDTASQKNREFFYERSRAQR
ncbi:MAG: DNA endonuclease SmrA [Alcanivorax sp.]|nr:DNA endonuclease SmrA [Alcanivorax sp.]